MGLLYCLLLRFLYKLRLQET